MYRDFPEIVQKTNTSFLMLRVLKKDGFYVFTVIFFLFSFLVLGMEPRSLVHTRQHSTTELQLQPWVLCFRWLKKIKLFDRKSYI